MKRYLQVTICVFTAIAFCLLNGCSPDSNNKSTENHFDPYSDQYCFIKWLTVERSMVSSESGYYFVRNYYLYYTDKSTMKTVPLCNKPDCLHAEETDRRKRVNCNAYISGDDIYSVGDLISYGSNFYLYRFIIDRSQNEKNLLTQVSLDGTQKKDVFTFNCSPEYIIIHRGYLYYSTTDNGTVGGEEDSTISKSGIYRVPMDDLNKTPELIYENNGIYANVTGLKAYENNVYFTCSSFTDAAMQNRNSDLMCYRIDTGNALKISGDAGRSAICAGKLVYYIDDQHKAICDLDGQNKEILEGVIGLPYCDDKFLLTDTVSMELKNKDIERKLYFYDLSGKELQSFSLEEYNGAMIFGSDGGYVFLMTTTTVDKQKIIYEYWRIDKSKIAEGSAKMEKYYTYAFNPNPDMD